MKILDRYTRLFLVQREKVFSSRDLVGIFGISSNNAKVILSRMLSAGMAERRGRDRYAVRDPLSYMIVSSYGRDIIRFLEEVCEKKYYITGPSALSFYGLASGAEYYVSVEETEPVDRFSEASGLQVLPVKRQVFASAYKRASFEGRDANVASIETALAESFLLGDEAVQFYAVPAVGDFLERGYDLKKLLKAAEETKVRERLDKVISVYRSRGYKMSYVPKVKPSKKEEVFILGGINV